MLAVLIPLGLPFMGSCALCSQPGPCAREAGPTHQKEITVAQGHRAGQQQDFDKSSAWPHGQLTVLTPGAASCHGCHMPEKTACPCATCTPVCTSVSGGLLYAQLHIRLCSTHGSYQLAGGLRPRGDRPILGDPGDLGPLTVDPAFLAPLQCPSQPHWAEPPWAKSPRKA